MTTQALQSMIFVVIIRISPYLGIGCVRGASQEAGAQSADTVFTPGRSIIEFSKIYFFDIVTTDNDHPRYVKHDLSSMYVFFTLFGLPEGSTESGDGGAPRFVGHLEAW